MERMICLVIGYVFGCFLTGELVARRRTGAGAARLGTGNPGMANLAHELGLRWGLLTLLGDLAKTALACSLCVLLTGAALGRIALLWAALGAALGHNFPFWRRFRGGKGVAVTCAGLILYSPLWGTVACLCGLAVTLLTGWLPLGAVVIPMAFFPLAVLFHGWEAGALAAALTALMVSRHHHGLARIRRGEEPRKFRPK
ncbi:glycerol-3-phosphate acyltransferase [uncultured Flavonifractor sp.]|uniref:glycerol-3-phosphate acyltransferase n=1 Tax=uncultured Flavonifractor sp. TaxID=1193534 RepID=UPI00263276A6|nr:glycerol-3-phosphate acyltransferase [uncultured Flavonifractor sp.]